MTRSSGKPSSDSDLPAQLPTGDIRVWLGASAASDSDTFSRALLSRFTGLAPADLEIERGEQGKPRLVNGPLALPFSLSHSGDWMVFALSRNVEIGVDIEVHDSRRELLRLARRFFSEAETQVLESLHEGPRIERFYDLWTLKEARIKALGSSLGRELEVSSFTIEDAARGLPAISSRPSSSNTFYGLMTPRPGYSLALCALSPSLPPPSITVYSLSQSGEEHRLPIELRACSPG